MYSRQDAVWGLTVWVLSWQLTWKSCYWFKHLHLGSEREGKGEGGRGREREGGRGMNMRSHIIKSNQWWLRGARSHTPPAPVLTSEGVSFVNGPLMPRTGSGTVLSVWHVWCMCVLITGSTHNLTSGWRPGSLTKWPWLSPCASPILSMAGLVSPVVQAYLLKLSLWLRKDPVWMTIHWRSSPLFASSLLMHHYLELHVYTSLPF